MNNASASSASTRTAGPWDLSRTAKFTSANPKIAEVDAAGIVRPVGDGETTITIEVERQDVRRSRSR